MRYVHHRFHRL